tara:strand:- start:1003 stop:1431 length:429 start_codon:yes stop_codon:yes gene_type:complete
MATGQYKKQNLLPSDLDVTVVRAAAAPTTSYVASTEIDCRGFREVDFFVDVATAGSITKLTVKPETGQALSSSTIEYASYLTETISSGVATTNDYEVELTDPAPSTTPVYKVTVPVEGRYIRVSLKSDHASGTVGIYAQRRV